MTRLRTKENIVNFVILSEGTGILQANILGRPAMIEFDPEFAIGVVGMALVSRANALGHQRQFQGVKDVLELALLLNPKFVPAWSSMAIAAFEMKDCQTAVYWADRVLNYTPDSESDDIWERGGTAITDPNGGREVAELLGEPELIDSWEQVQQQMKAIKQACGRLKP